MTIEIAVYSIYHFFRNVEISLNASLLYNFLIALFTFIQF